MRAALVLVALVGVAAGVLHMRRLLSKWRLERDWYRWFDETLGALEFEKTRAVTGRFHHERWPGYGPTLGRLVAAFWYPTPRLAGAVVTPDWWRRRIYVRFTLRRVAWPGRYRRWHATTPAMLHWSTEVKGRVNPTAPIFDHMKERAALALGLEPRPDLFELEIDWASHVARLDLRRPAKPRASHEPYQEIDAS